MSFVTGTFVLNVLQTSVPAWFTALGHKQWAQPVGNTIQSVADPLMLVMGRGVGNYGEAAGPSSIITGWTGAVCDQSLRTIAFLGNGGHNDYWGNEVYSFDLSAASPVWVRRRNATLADTFGSGASRGQWLDGRPVSDHTGDYCVAANGKWFKCGLGAPNYNGGEWGHFWWSFDPAANDYTYLGNTYPRQPDGYSISCSTAFDPSRNRIIKCIPNVAVGVRSYSLAGAEVDSIAAYFATGTILASLDTTNDVLLVRAYASNTCYAINLATKAIATFTATGTRPTDSTAKIHWHAASNAFVTWDGAQGLLKLTPTVVGGNYTAAEWSPVGGATGVVPSGVNFGGGMYSKIQLITNMGDGTAALVIVPKWSTMPNKDVWVMRLTGAV